LKKILFIHHTAGRGGASNSLVKLINYLDKTKYDAEVLLLKNSEIEDKLVENGIKYSIAGSVFYRKYYRFFAHSEAGYVRWYRVFRFFRLGTSWILSRYFFSKKELARHEFDIVHLNSSSLTDWLAPAKKRGETVIHIREPFRKGRLDLLRFFFRRTIKKYADQVIAISKDNARRINLPGKTKIIYNYSEIPAVVPSESSYSSKKVLYLGGSDTSKGFFVLVKALDYLDEDVKVYFGGKYVNDKHDNLIQYLKFILSNGKKRNSAIIKITNYVNAKIIGHTHDTGDFLEEVCCLVSPFKVPHFSRPVIEAHLHRKPAIGSDVEGMDEIIKHNENGLIVPKNNPEALAAAINELTADIEKAKRFGEEGYKIAVQKFTPRNIKQIEHIYSRLCQNQEADVINNFDDINRFLK